MNYDCYFQVSIRQESENGIDLEDHRMNEICYEIGKILSKRYHQGIKVSTLGFEVVK